MNGLFDSLTHPRLAPGGERSFAAVEASLRQNGFSRACAVAMPDDPDYDDGRWLQACANHPVFVAVAPLLLSDDLPLRMAEVARQGFAAVKIHPRLLGPGFSPQWLVAALQAAADHNVPVMLCTYFAHRFGVAGCLDFEGLVACLRQVPATNVVLLHGGTTRLLELSEIVRHNPNLLLDISFTLCKYPGSSLDNDLKFLAQLFDRRICVGSDWPDFDHAQTRARYDWLVAGLAPEQADNIGFGNLARFLRLEAA